MKKLIVIVILVILPFVVQAERVVDSGVLDKYIREVVKDFKLQGLAVAVVKNDKVVFSKGYGPKELGKKGKVDAQSLFNIASCSKAFTSACIGILVDEGKLGWNDKVIDYLPEFRLEDPYITRHLTIRDILSHRTGFGTFDGDLLWYRTDYGNEEIIRRMQYLPITKRFRDEFGYQNNMYITAGEVVRKVSGLTWGEFLKRKILEPLEMKTSRACSQLLEKGMNVARPHVEGKTYPFYVQRSNAAASIYSSIDEMSNWMRMLLNGGKWKDRQILKPGTVEMLFTPQMVFPTSPFMKKNGTHFRTYALGWGAWDYYGNKVVEHSGGMPGYISRVTLVPGKKLGIVILTNNLNGAASPLRYKILDLFLTGKQTDWKKTFLEMQEKQEKRGKERKAKREKERVKGTRSSLELGKYAGQYEDRVYGKAEILMEQETLTLTLLPSKDVFTSKMEHWHFDTFRIRFKDAFLPDGFVTFEFDSNGAVTGFKIDLPNPDFHFHHLHFKKN